MSFKVGDLVLINGDSELGNVENRVGVCVETDESHVPVCAKIKSPYWYLETEVSPVPEHFYVELPEENREEWSRKLQQAWFDTGGTWLSGSTEFKHRSKRFLAFDDFLHLTESSSTFPKLTPEDALTVLESRKKDGDRDLCQDAVQRQMAASFSIPSHILEKPMSESTETKTTIERRIAKGAWKATGWLIRPVWNRVKRVGDIGLNLVLAGAAIYGLMYFGGDGVVYLLDLLNDKMAK